MKAPLIQGLAAIVLLIAGLLPIGATAAATGIQLANRTHTLVMSRV